MNGRKTECDQFPVHCYHHIFSYERMKAMEKKSIKWRWWNEWKEKKTSIKKSISVIRIGLHCSFACRHALHCIHIYDTFFFMTRDLTQSNLTHIFRCCHHDRAPIRFACRRLSQSCPQNTKIHHFSLLLVYIIASTMMTMMIRSMIFKSMMPFTHNEKHFNFVFVWKTNIEHLLPIFRGVFE